MPVPRNLENEIAMTPTHIRPTAETQIITDVLHRRDAQMEEFSDYISIVSLGPTITLFSTSCENRAKLFGHPVF